MELSVMMPTHPGHRRFIKTCAEHCRELGAKDITILYDNKIKLSAGMVDVKNYLPPDDVCREVDSVILNRRDLPYGGVSIPWYFEQRDGMGLAYARKSELMLSINGDCVITNKDGFHRLLDKFLDEDYDLCPCHYHVDNFGTMGFLIKGKAYVEVFTHFMEVLHDSQTNAEARLAVSSRHIGLKVMDTGFPVDRAFSRSEKASDGVWAKQLGFIHLHGTEKYRIGSKILPLEEKYYDKRFLRANEVSALTAYWKTGNTKHLYEHNYWRK